MLMRRSVNGWLSSVNGWLSSVNGWLSSVNGWLGSVNGVLALTVREDQPLAKQASLQTDNR